MNKPAIIAMLCFMPFTAQAALSDRLSADDERRMTRETPYRMDCPLDETRGLHDCAAEYAPSAQEREEYLPPVVPEHEVGSGIVKPTFVRLMKMITTSCQKAGKNSEFCVESERYGADDYQAGLFQ